MRKTETVWKRHFGAPITANGDCSRMGHPFKHDRLDSIQKQRLLCRLGSADQAMGFQWSCMSVKLDYERKQCYAVTMMLENSWSRELRDNLSIWGDQPDDAKLKLQSGHLDKNRWKKIDAVKTGRMTEMKITDGIDDACLVTLGGCVGAERRACYDFMEVAKSRTATTGELKRDLGFPMVFLHYSLS